MTTGDRLAAHGAGPPGGGELPTDPPRPDPVVDAVSRLLTAGTIVVIALVAAGTALALAAGRRPVEQRGPDLDFGRLIMDVASLRPEGVLWLGLMLGLALPTARTVVAFVGFLRTGDRRASMVAAGVLLALAVSAVVALLTG